MLIALVSHLNNESLEEATDCRTVSYPTMQLMQAYFPKTRMLTFSVQKSCDAQPHEHGQRMTVAEDCKEHFVQDIEYPSTFMKDNLFSFGDNRTLDQDAFTVLELLLYLPLEELG